MRTPTLLVVDDTGERIKPMRRAAAEFEKRHGTTVSFRSVVTPRDLHERTQRGELYDGVIVDFALNDRPDQPIGFDWNDIAGRTYGVTTGIGCLDYLRMHHHYADAPLWAITNIGARHAPLFYGAAWLWFNARPLNFGDFNTDNPQFQMEAIGDVVAAILSTQEHGLAAPLAATRFNGYVEDRAAAFDELLTEDPAIEVKNTAAIDVFAWIAALSAPAKLSARRGLTSWYKQVYIDAATMDGVTPAPEATLERNVLNKHHWRWNRPLQDLFKWDFAGGDRFPDWPEHDPNGQGYRSQVALRTDLLAEFDPYTEVLGAPEPREFLTSADVYAALKRWRTAPR